MVMVAVVGVVVVHSRFDYCSIEQVHMYKRKCKNAPALEVSDVERCHTSERYLGRTRPAELLKLHVNSS